MISQPEEIEWYLLLMEAKKIGLTTEEVRRFISKRGENRVKFDSYDIRDSSKKWDLASHLYIIVTIFKPNWEDESNDDYGCGRVHKSNR